MSRPADALPREERRVVTVVFTDLVGFTERSEELDPEDVRALLTRYYASTRSIFEEHGGTVDKFIGDAVLAVFGAPVAHEDDPERAVRAALAVCDWARGTADITVRVGVNAGSALVALEQSETGMGIVAGDIVNTASRIQSAAPAGGVLVGASVYDATRGVFEYEEREAIEAKGKKEPVRVWEAVRAQASAGGARRVGDTMLVGRDAELRALAETFERARAGEPQLLTLVGVPGIGKTRLVAELERIARERARDVTWLEGRSPSYGAGTSVWALGEMVRAHAAIMETDDAAVAEAKLATAVGALAGQTSDERWLAGQLRALVGLASEGALREEGREETFAAWRRFFELLATRGPLVLVFDDLHWADDTVLAFIDDLVARAGSAPLLVLGTARPELLERRPDWPGGAARRATMALQPLSSAETSDLVRALARDLAITPDTEAALLERAAGNPLYAEEFVRMIAEGGRDPDASLPPSVQGIIAARLDALTPPEKDVLQDASVVGQVFWPGALRRVAEGNGHALDERLLDLERKEFVVRAPDSSFVGEPELAFRHPLIREVAYEQMPRALRAGKHVRAAEWAESLPADRAEARADILSHHYVRALEYTRAVGEDTEELRARASHALREAGDYARSLHSLDSAAERYVDALELAATQEDRARLQLALAEVELRTGAVDEAFRHLDDVIAISRAADHPDLLARAALARGGVGVSVFDPDEDLVALLEEALEALGSQHLALRARLLARLAIEVYYVPPPTRREELSEEAVSLAREADEPEALLDALNARRVTLWSPDHLDERLAVSRELVERAEASGDRERSLLARTWLVLDLVEGGDFAAARAEIDAYCRLVEPLGIPAYSWWVPAWRAMLAGVEGRFDDVRALAQEAREIGARAQDGNAAIYFGLACWIADTEQGRDLDSWLPMIEKGVERGGPSDAFRCGLAMQLALVGRLDDARDALAELGPRGLGEVVKDMNFYAGAGEFTTAVGVLGDAERAAEAYETLRPYAGRMFTIARAAVCWGPADSFLARLAATAGMWDEAEAHFGAALAACERSGARAMAARTRWWHAEMLRARGAPGDDERAADLAAAAGAEAERMGLALSPWLSG